MGQQLGPRKLTESNGKGPAAGFISTDFTQLEFSGVIILAEK